MSKLVSAQNKAAGEGILHPRRKLLSNAGISLRFAFRNASPRQTVHSDIQPKLSQHADAVCSLRFANWIITASQADRKRKRGLNDVDGRWRRTGPRSGFYGRLSRVIPNDSTCCVSGILRIHLGV